MTKRALILVEGNRSTGELYVKAAKRLGLHPITLSADPTQYDYLAADDMETIRVDTDNLDALISECSRVRATYDIAGITGFTGLDELAYATVGKLCRSFALPGPNPSSIERCCDKFTQRQILAEAGVPMPAYRLASNAADVQSCAAEINLPVILKPAVGSGSSGVLLCRDVDELAKHTIHLLGGKHKWRASPRILVEEFAQGPYYWADIMGNEVIGIGGADFGRPPHFVHRGCTYPAVLTDVEQQRIADVSLSCLEALSLGWGPSNIGFRWTRRGPVVIEVNPRLAGAPGPQMVKLVYGIDLVTEHIKVVIGEESDLRSTRSHVAGARFLLPEGDGILDWIDGASRAAAIEGVSEVKLHVQPKTPIVREGDYRDTIGHVIAASPSRPQTDAILQHAVALIDWSITSVSALGETEHAVAPYLPPGAEMVTDKGTHRSILVKSSAGDDAV
ncbi:MULTISPECIES: acetyl-CoA carboxylase biotin carboxylase subunit family protein [unclassified Mesorhizobium]|uniref:ATP-grasp domain-containing protein n=1 Tax=unclassified Mesorhizobium TaxID=325217 RepID=UPI000F74FB09|nr:MULTISPECIES: acetyl-CoA carboxylase biotin carboxylase subunit family protein [unclassified Mesorhizobium]RUX07876.1 ATP-grasp domain-containing protein [Mesorhizobium sp. M8A.F.Ca.ET.059.01.1.1]AZO52338.1 ATP-grasp domain-containing protein [Mesorhizobium sp. M8A.F.Ca.ET.057.01.1.1]RWE32225.1 MAG: ATP-grasp domain-containing protein [Mesorhizobium sp.]RWE41022.1 MAG: ATP-grasp domain-containing protein [Mesorhizobium sp.]RWE81417.1 MAG: ATP-grasp domain-containing protein [Mesorhizobium s